MNEHWDAYIEGPALKNVTKERQPELYSYVPDGDDSSGFTLIQPQQER
jgi:hypothetical protein